MASESTVRRYARLGRKRVGVGWRRFALAVAPSPRSRDAERALARLDGDARVLFLCLGNICRSPMAERYCRRTLDAADAEGVTATSAGFVEAEGRGSPDAAIAAAGEFGVDLSEHRSRQVTEGMLARSDLVLLMDAYNLALLERRFGGFADRACFLGAFADGDYEIPDPYGADRAAFRAVYGDVAAAVDALVAGLEADGDA